MDFELSDDQKMLVETATSFVKKESPVSRLRRLREDPTGFDPAMWRQMGEMGWLGILFPEDLGGFGGSFLDLCLVLEQLGTTLVPEPFIPSVVLGGMSILHAGSTAQHQRWLAPLIEGKTTLALAYAERQGRHDVTDVQTRAAPGEGGYRLTGEKVFVLGGHAADALVVSAMAPGGLSLFVLDRDTPGLHVQPIQTMDGLRAAMVRLDGAAVAADRLLGAEGAAGPVLDKVMDLAAAAACAEGLGIVRASLDMTLEYLKTREQFGVKIGSFQALQHRAVDMFVEVELCRTMAIYAGIKADDADPAERRSAVSAAKVQLAEGGRFVVRQAVQLHGGVGCTEEHDIGLYFKRLHVLSALFGDDVHHMARFAAQPSFTADLG